MQAVCVSEERSVATELEAWLDLYVPDDVAVSLEFSKARCHARVEGALAYHGEMWLADNYRARNLGSALYRLGVLAAAARWQLDQCWGLFHDDKANGRYLVLSGYSYMAAGVDWRDGFDRTVLNEALVWTPAPDIRAIAAEVCEAAQEGDDKLIGSLAKRYYTPAIKEVKVA